MTENNEVKPESREQQNAAIGGISIRIIGAVAIIVAIALAFFAFTMAGLVTDCNDAARNGERGYIECSQAIEEVQHASDYLTSQARLFVVTGRREAMDAYIEELNVTNRRGRAVEMLKTKFMGDKKATAELEQAINSSDDLAENELAAMRLAAEYYGTEGVPDLVADASIAAVGKSEGLSREQKLDTAKELVLGTGYEVAKSTISSRVEASSKALLDELDADLEASNDLMENLLFQLRISVALLLCVVMVLVLVLLMYVLKPLSRYIKLIQKNEPLVGDGAYELRYMANAYNTVYEDNSKRIEQLRQFAERDPLTGISNRNGYDKFLATHTRNVALLLIDIDDFKDFNTVYGRDVGNAAIIKLANALSTAFRSTDFPCRIESDKFAVIMTNMNTDLHDAVLSKIEIVNSILADDSDDLPLITVSVGAAFSTEGMTDQEIYRAAETALKQAQKSGNNTVAFYGEGNASEETPES